MAGQTFIVPGAGASIRKGSRSRAFPLLAKISGCAVHTNVGGGTTAVTGYLYRRSSTVRFVRRCRIWRTIRRSRHAITDAITNIAVRTDVVISRGCGATPESLESVAATIGSAVGHGTGIFWTISGLNTADTRFTAESIVAVAGYAIAVVQTSLPGFEGGNISALFHRVSGY